MTSKAFYVYAHCDQHGVPFYVGKGFGRRAYDLKNRTRYHQSKIDLIGAANIQIMTFPAPSEAEAFAREVELIRWLRAIKVKLVNLTDGGEGASGAIRKPWGDASRRKMSATRKGVPLSAHHAEQAAKQLASVSRLAAEWHASEAGNQWHREHGRNTWIGRGRTSVTCQCDECSNVFETAHPTRARFCSSACKERARQIRNGIAVGPRRVPYLAQQYRR